MEISDALKLRMIEEARAEHRPAEIGPCGERPTLLQSFTRYEDTAVLWFNVGKDTHCLMEPIQAGRPLVRTPLKH